MHEAIAALLGAIIGGLISVLGQWWLRKEERKHEEKAIASAISAEIDGYLDLMERRNHESIVRRKITKLERGEDVSFENLLTQYEINNNPFPIVRNHLDRIGLLGKESSDVTRFYNLIFGIRVTIISFKEGNFDKNTPFQKAEIAKRELEIWEDARQLGRDLVRRLREH